MGDIELTVAGTSLRALFVQGRAALSELFSLSVSASTSGASPASQDLLGQPFSITIHDDMSGALDVHGIVMAVERSTSAEGALFELSLGPEAAALTLGRDHRIFQDMNVTGVLERVLAAANVNQVRFATQRSYEERPYWVQYGESDWAFVERLLAEEGLYFWFDFSQGTTTLVIADDSTRAPPIEGDSVLRHHVGLGLRASSDGVLRVGRTSRLTPSAARLRDYNPDKPRLTLDAKAGEGDREIYDWPGRFASPSSGQARAANELESRRARRSVLFGHTGSTRLHPGLSFEMAEHPLASYNARFTVVSVTLSAGERRSFSASWTAIPRDTPFRTPRAPRAVGASHGPETAWVTGAAGQEVHPDKRGHVRAKFRWDRAPARDETSSTWMRVGQFPLGGSMVLPRVGWDVLIHHHEGDIDAPLVVSHLYDGEHPVPYALPAQKTRTAWQTATTPGGGSSNEVRFEDKAGGEEIFINASKDMNVTIGDNRQEKIGVDHVHDIGANYSVEIGADLKAGVTSNQDVSVGGSETLSVGADRGISIGGSETASVGGSRDVTAMLGVSLDATGGRTLTTGGSMLSAAALGVSRAVLGTMSVSVGGSWISAAATGLANMTGGAAAETVGGAKLNIGASGCETSVKGALAETVGGAYVIASGANAGESASGALAITVGGALLVNAPSIEIEGASEISVRAGASSLTITSSSIELKAPSLASPGAVITKKASQVNHN